VSKAIARTATIAAVIALAGCGGGGTSLPPAVSTTKHAATGKVTFTMKWPTAKSPRASWRRLPQFISPSTASVAVEVNGGTPQFFNNPSTSGSGTVSTLNIAAPVGTDDFVFSLWDGPNGTGEELGQAEVSANVAPAAVTQITAEVVGIVSTVAIAPAAGQTNVLQSTDSTGKQTFSIVSDTPVTFTLTPEDADGNVIIYPANDPNTPVLNLSSTEPNLSITPVSANPNEFVVRPTGIFANPSVGLQATVNDDFGVVTSTYALSETPVTYVAWQNSGTGSIKGYDPTQHPIALSGSFPGVVNPVGLVYDQSDHIMFVADAGAAGGEILAFDAQGNAIPGFKPLSVPGITSITFAPKVGEVFATVGPTNSIVAFNAQGASIPYSSSNLSSPIAISYDLNNEQLYVANATLNYGWDGFDTSGDWNVSGLDGITTEAPTGIAADGPDNVVAQTFNGAGGAAIVSYSANGSPQDNTVTQGLNGPAGLTFNPIAKEFYVVNGGANNITGYTVNAANGNITYDPTFQIVDPSVTKPSAVTVVI